MALLPLMDAIIKHLGAWLPVIQIAWARLLFQSLIIMPFAVGYHGWKELRAAFTLIHLLRSVLLVAAILCFFNAIQLMPIVDAVAIGANYPIIVTALAPVLLGETVGRHRWIAVGAGALGAFIMIRPGFHEVNMGAWLSLLGSFVFALHILLTRKVSFTTPASITVAFSASFGCLVLFPVMPFIWIPPTFSQWLWLGLSGVLVSVASYLIVRAYAMAPASLLGPFSYTDLIFSALVSYFIFSNAPDIWTVAGAGIIVVSGIYISFRERRPGIRTERAMENNSPE